MNLIPFTFNGATINDGANYVAKLIETSHNQGEADIIEIDRTNNTPLYAGKELKSKGIYVNVEMKGTAATQIEAIKKVFDISDHNQYAFVCKDSVNSDKQWYVNATPINEDWIGNVVTYALNTDEYYWKSVTINAGTFSGTSSPGTLSITPGGNKYALPVFSIAPTSSKGTSYAYKRFVTLYNTTTRDYGNYPVNLTDNGSGTAYIAGSTLVAGTKLQSDGDDWRHYCDGAEVYRWFGGTVNSAQMLAWSNISIPPKQEMTLGSAIGTADAGTVIYFKDTNANEKALRAIRSTGILKLDSEIYTYSAKSVKKHRVTSTRAAKGSTAGSHAVGGTATWLPHDLWVVYGNTAATAPEQDDNYKPIINLNTSTNKTWDWDEFAEADGLRTGAWKPSIVSSAGGDSIWYGGSKGTITTDPYTEMGCELVSWKKGANWQTEKGNITWSLYQPAGATSLIYSGFKYASTSSSWPDVAGFLYSNTTTNYTQNNIASPASYGSWIAVSGTITPATLQRYWKWELYGSIKASANNITYVECTDLTQGLYEPPYVSLGAEQTNYHLNLTIENTTTGEKIILDTPMGLNQTLIVDCEAQEVYLYNDDSNLMNALSTNDESRDEWMTLLSGQANQLVFTEDGMAGMQILVNWEDREL
jgi:hypothetical protein